MNKNWNNPDLGSTIKALLKERSLSMRKLSALTGIDTATISRIVNGKQAAKPDHLKVFSLHLGVPIERLFQAAGYNVGTNKTSTEIGIHTSIDRIKEVLQSSNFFDYELTTELVQKELFKYEQYALTEEGQRVIHNEFSSKVEKVNGSGPFIDELRQMHELFCSREVSQDTRAIAGSALLYFILSADIIPDYVFPIGYLDDAIAVQMVRNRLSEESS
ncbi:DUF1232 domain-containing protein [Paenibacillus larvae]|uniref:DUF1232 domain-containing protein n=1 Tax=Paenibacillus larvae TaxID=1464 RepID=UPI00228108AB|nr:DUF1232 domain-containing protein [Paenibacillus larvae]MCY9509925.1 DUF1232 domain-containing protein [Paenibacillus larvae]MCY9524822.1 DUF1232 domain-containing protein [Paenibacillus larvae]